MKKKVLKGSLIAIIVLIATICGLFAYSEKISKIEVIENAKKAVGDLVSDLRSGTNSVDMTVDITNIVNDAYPEHEHIWYDEYDETNHWKKCSICKEVKDFAVHELSAQWSMGHEGCENNNHATITCLCGYGYEERIPHTWDGVWRGSDIINAHGRNCTVCGNSIGGMAYYDMTNGGILIEDTSDFIYENGIKGPASTCILEDGTPRPCGTNTGVCVICGGPNGKANYHYYGAYSNGLVKCTNCGNIRWNLYCGRRKNKRWSKGSKKFNYKITYEYRIWSKIYQSVIDIGLLIILVLTMSM